MSVESLITKHIDIWTSAVQTKSTAGRGTSSKLDLYGIKKLRELILELAVCGKLVPQDPNDEPASVLLERIEKEKTQLVKEKKIKKPKKLENISEDEMFFELPVGWKWVRLNDLGEWGSGSTPKRSISEYYGGEIPWFKSGELNQDYISQSEEYITELALKETSVRYNHIGDVLVAMYGATIGKTSILSVRATTNQAVCACTPFTGFLNTYLLLLLKASKSRLVGMGAGGAQPNISREKIINTVTALPPEKEQHRIVAKVDELMVLCDQLEQQTEASIAAHQVLVENLLATLTNSSNADELMENWQRISAHFDTLFTTIDAIDQLKQTILQLAVMGKLVPQNPADEPASVLLGRIAKEKAQLVKEGKIKKQKALSPIADDEKPFELPDGWECTMLDDIFVVTGGLQKTPKRAPVLNHYPYLAVANVQRGKLELDDLKRFEVTDDELERYKLEFGDLMVVEGNGSDNEIGRCAIWQGEIDNCLHQNHLIRCRPLLSEISGWVLQTLNSPFGINEMKTLAVTSSGLYNLSVGKIRSVHIPIPPLDEQSRIVSKTRELITICDQLKAHIHEVQKGHLKLTDAIVEQSI